MQGVAPIRTPRENEVRTLVVDGGGICIAIVKQREGRFLYYKDPLSYDSDEDVYYWSVAMTPASGVYGSIEDAERDIRLRYGLGPSEHTDD